METRPDYKRPNGAGIPDALKAIPRWVLWRAEQRDGKWTKPPMKADGGYAKSNDPATWADFPKAWKSYYENAGKYDGVGLAVNGDGLLGVDMDHVLTGRTIKPEAEKIVSMLKSYTEITPSGDGLRIWCRGKLPPGNKVKDGFAGAGTKIEFYESGRYFTVTGRPWTDETTITDRATEILQAHASIFGTNGGKEKAAPRPQTSAPGMSWRERLERAFKSKTGAEIHQLWNGGDQGGDHSSDDLALCSHLAFWFSGNEVDIDQAFRESGLMRPKWDEKHFSDGRTYGQATIRKAVEGCRSFYQDRTETKREQREEPAETASTSTTNEQVFPFTDMGNAERLVHRFGNDIRFCPARNRWILWTGSHWSWDDCNEIERLAKLTVRGIFQEAVTAKDDKVKDIGKHAVRSESAARIKAMIDLAQTENGVAIRPAELDRDPWLLNVGNGTLDLRTGKISIPSRGNLITRRIDTPFDPEAASPLWTKFLHTVMAGNDGLIHFLRKAVGYSLTGETREQVLFFSHGRGANGKSTFIETITGLMGAFSKHTRPETFMLKNTDSSANNDLAELEGCRMVAAVELEEGKRLAEVLTKQATGGDTLKARYLFQEFFEFQSQFKLWLCGNHKPRITGTDLAIWRRIRLIPWTVTIPENEQDKELTAKLKAEWPGILAWAVQGCLDWQREGLTAPVEVMAATASYRREMDILGDFFDNCIQTGENITITVKELYDAYVSYCEANGESIKERLGKKKFGVRVSERGFDQFSATGNVQTWIGLKLKK